LRGRIGRGAEQAYAYFLIHANSITEKAESRLDAIREFANLGSGYKIAEFDLKLRGAGSLLGNKQHGHIEALGFDYYHQLLLQTIEELKGTLEVKPAAQFHFHFSYAVESGYMENSMERIEFYKKILAAPSFSEIKELQSDLEDRYGQMPESTLKIIYAALMKLLLKDQPLITEVDIFQNRIILHFPPEYFVQASNFSLPPLEPVCAVSQEKLSKTYFFDDFRKIIHHLLN
jgi:transcription-repair coupling factor (superfamily II helicase)